MRFLLHSRPHSIVPGGHKYSVQLSCVLNWKCSYSERLDRALDLNRLSVYVFKVTKRVHVQLSSLLDLIPIPLFRSDHGWHTSSHRQCQVIAHQLIYISTLRYSAFILWASIVLKKKVSPVSWMWWEWRNNEEQRWKFATALEKSNLSVTAARKRINQLTIFRYIHSTHFIRTKIQPKQHYFR